MKGIDFCSSCEVCYNPLTVNKADYGFVTVHRPNPAKCAGHVGRSRTNGAENVKKWGFPTFSCVRTVYLLGFLLGS